MLQQAERVVVIKPGISAPHPLAPLQPDQTLDERISRRLPQWIPHRNVQLIDRAGNGVQHRQQQRFVGQHDGRLFIRRFAAVDQFLQKSMDVLALQSVGRRGNDDRFFGSSEMVVPDPRLRRRRIIPDIVPQEHPRLVIFMINVIRIVVPVELGAAAFFQSVEQSFLTGRQRIESDHDITAVRIAGQGDRFVVEQSLGSRPVNHAFISQSLRRKRLAEPVVNIGQRLPDRQEVPLFVGTGTPGAETLPKLPNHPDLIVRQIRMIAFERFQIADVREQHIRIDQVFVDLVEIGQQHIPPEIEGIETLVVNTGINLVKFGNQLDPVAAAQARQPFHQFADANESGLPQRPVNQRTQRIAKEKLRPAVREYQP